MQTRDTRVSVYALQTANLFRNTHGFTYRPASKEFLSTELISLTQLWFRFDRCLSDSDKYIPENFQELLNSNEGTMIRIILFPTHTPN
jgi:hypothetical protein